MLILLCSLSGCRFAPKHCVPHVPIPEEWQKESFTSNDIELDPCGELLSMWELFDDPLLTEYLKSIIYTNLDVKLAYAKVYEAYSMRRMAVATLFPFLDGRVDYHTSKPAGGILTGQDTGGGVSPLGMIPLNLKQQSFLADFDAAWELDFFGRRRSEVEAATAFVGMEIENRNLVLVTLLSEFGRTYLELRKQQKNAALFEREINIMMERKEQGEIRLENGLASEQSVLEMDASVRRLKADLATLEGNISSSIYHLSILAGKPPYALVDELKTLSYFPEMRNKIPVGVPSHLLRRRPDIRRAERQIAQATAEIGVAVGELFPKIVIDGSYGFQNLHLGNLKGQGESYSFGGNLLVPLFHGGKLRANVAKSQWIRKEALIQYENTVIKALEEAESAMVRLIKSKESLEEKYEAYTNQKQMLSHIQDLFDNGLANQIDLLDAQINSLNAEISWITQEGDTGIQLIALYKALGGGWQCSN
jgi:NodT family efflux transporter outer membrane factor (OMF) lipoprotein